MVSKLEYQTKIGSDSQSLEIFYNSDSWFVQGNGPRYQQLHRMMSEAIKSGALASGEKIPPERVLAELADVSRVTVRKTVALLVKDRLVEQRRGAGTYVRDEPPRMQQSLSSLVSFTENFRARGYTPSSVTLERGLFTPKPDEVFALGLSPGSRIARIKRQRWVDDIPVAIEVSTLPEDILPQPNQVETSLYDVLRADDRAPTRAIQRVNAVSLKADDAALLHMAPNEAALAIERTGYLAHGRPIEYTRGIYRSEIYDFVSELKLDT